MDERTQALINDMTAHQVLHLLEMDLRAQLREPKDAAHAAWLARQIEVLQEVGAELTACRKLRKAIKFVVSNA